MPCDDPLQFAPAMTTVKVSVDTKKKLKEWKKRFGAKSIDALLQSMDPEEMDPEAPAGASADEGEDVGEPVKRRKINVREELYSLEILSEREGMLEYYTGFDRPTVDLLIRRFSEVRLERVFFLLLSFCQEASCGYGPRVLLLSSTHRSSNPKLLIGVRATTAIESSICPSESSCSSLG